MNWRDIFNPSKWGKSEAPQAPSAPEKKRSYSGAIISRLTSDWEASNFSANSEIWLSLWRLRARSRELERNNRYIRKFVESQIANIIGSEGFRLQMAIKDPDGTPDRAANKAVEEAWEDWGDVCTIDDLDWHSALQIILRRCAIDGEIFLRKRIVRLKSGGYEPRLELIEADRLDENFTGSFGGNRIIMSVEVDEFGKPVAYHVLNYIPTDPFVAPVKERIRERVDASEIIHVFVKDRPGQIRGVPWTAPVMQAIHHFEGYEQAEVIAARVAAGKMGFFRDPDGQEYQGDIDENDGSKITTAEPGTFEDIGRQEFVQYDPSHPNQNYPAFAKTQLRGIASGLGESYNILANDLEGVNFSSLRGGVLDARESYKLRQKWLARICIEPIFHWWLEMALLAGSVKLMNGSPLPLAKLEKFAKPTWRGRRWDWVDPFKDLQATELALGLKITSRRRVLAEMGEDIDDTFEEIQADEELAEQMGIDLSMPDTKLPNNAGMEPDQGGETQPEGDANSAPETGSPGPSKNPKPPKKA